MVEWEPLSSQGCPPDRNHVPQLRDRKGHGRARREAAPRAALDAGWPLGDPPVGGNLWNPGGKPGNSAESVQRSRDDPCTQRRPRWSSLGVRGDYPEEPDERSDCGGRGKYWFIIIRRSDPARFGGCRGTYGHILPTRNVPPPLPTPLSLNEPSHT